MLDMARHVLLVAMLYHMLPAMLYTYAAHMIGMCQTFVRLGLRQDDARTMPDMRKTTYMLSIC